MTKTANVIMFQNAAQNALRNRCRGIRRPRLLMAAARAGLAGWQRDRDLPRLLRSEALPHPRQALDQLLMREARHDEARRGNRGDHDLRGHILVLIAILAEMQALSGSATPAAAALP